MQKAISLRVRQQVSGGPACVMDLRLNVEFMRRMGNSMETGGKPLTQWPPLLLARALDIARQLVAEWNNKSLAMGKSGDIYSLEDPDSPFIEDEEPGADRQRTPEYWLRKYPPESDNVFDFSPPETLSELWDRVAPLMADIKNPQQFWPALINLHHHAFTNGDKNWAPLPLPRHYNYPTGFKAFIEKTLHTIENRHYLSLGKTEREDNDGQRSIRRTIQSVLCKPLMRSGTKAACRFVCDGAAYRPIEMEIVIASRTGRTEDLLTGEMQIRRLDGLADPGSGESTVEIIQQIAVRDVLDYEFDPARDLQVLLGLAQNGGTTGFAWGANWIEEPFGARLLASFNILNYITPTGNYQSSGLGGGWPEVTVTEPGYAALEAAGLIVTRGKLAAA